MLVNLQRFEVTASIPVVGPLNVQYRPEHSDGDFLDESAGPNNEDWSSGQNRLVPLTFDSDNKAMLMVATNDDEADTDGGSIVVTLQPDPAVTTTYLVSRKPGEETATAMVTKVPVPQLTIASNSISASTNEGSAVNITIQASENPKQPVTFSYTPTETGTTYLGTSYDRWHDL